jgi:ACR3 family arsenite efflux pump ArsB
MLTTLDIILQSQGNQIHISSRHIIRNILYYTMYYTIITVLEIKPCGLGSRIRDMEAESYN